MLLVDGLFGKNLKFCYVYDKLAKLKAVNPQEIYRMKISKIQEYFGIISDALCLFEGYDEDIRNAIAHSSFYYDSNKKKMIFEERRKGITKELTFQELRNLNTKMLNLDDLTIMITQLSKIRDGIVYARMNKLTKK